MPTVLKVQIIVPRRVVFDPKQVFTGLRVSSRAPLDEVTKAMRLAWPNGLLQLLIGYLVEKCEGYFLWFSDVHNSS